MNRSPDADTTVILRSRTWLIPRSLISFVKAKTSGGGTLGVGGHVMSAGEPAVITWQAVVELAQSQRVPGQLRLVTGPQLGPDSLHVGVDRRRGDPHPRCGLSLGETLGDIGECLPLS